MTVMLRLSSDLPPSDSGVSFLDQVDQDDQSPHSLSMQSQSDLAILLDISTPVQWTNHCQTLSFLVSGFQFDTRLLNNQPYTATTISQENQFLYTQVVSSVLHYLTQLRDHQHLFRIFYRLLNYLPMLILSLPPTLPTREVEARIKDKCQKFLNGKINQLFKQANRFADKLWPVKPLAQLDLERLRIARAESCCCCWYSPVLILISIFMTSLLVYIPETILQLMFIRISLTEFLPTQQLNGISSFLLMLCLTLLVRLLPSERLIDMVIGYENIGNSSLLMITRLLFHLYKELHFP